MQIAAKQIAIDTGGTFTDCVCMADGRLQVLKLPSTPADPGAAVVTAVGEMAGETPAAVRHGTTVGTNALLERKGARVAFITTAGFEDTLAIGRQARPELYNLLWEQPELLAARSMSFGVPERVAADGSILRRPTAEELAELRESVARAQPEAIAISLLFAFANPTHELEVAGALESLGVPISLSHRILPEFREYERGSTVVINAYLAPKMQSYLQALGRQLPGGLQVMQSSGGLIEAEVAAQEPVRTILSGPAGGVVGASAVAGRAGIDKILTFDMGGTSTDVALVDLTRPMQTTKESTVLGMPVAVPMLNIQTVGAGGGSIAGFDRGGALRVGPESAGAQPGPVCYGRGTQPTVTDANLLLGRFGSGQGEGDAVLAGSMALDRTRTWALFEEMRGSLASAEVFAEGIVRVVNAVMEKALRKISIEAGYDPREFTLLSFGGAGPLHACELARAMQIPRVLVPPMPGALSALGILLSDQVRDFSRTVMADPGDAKLAILFAELEATARAALPGGSVERSLDLRYRGQGFELTVDAGEDFLSRFHSEHQRRYGYADPERDVEVVNLRVRVRVAAAAPAFAPEPMAAGDGEQAVVAQRPVFAAGAWQPAKIYGRERLRAGDRFPGPCILLEYSATTYLPSFAEAAVDRWMNVVVDIAG